MAAGGTWRFWVTIVFLGLPIFWLIAGAFRAFIRPPNRLIYPTTTAQLLIVPFAAAMLLLALATIGFKRSERSWFQRDRMIRWDLARPG